MAKKHVHKYHKINMGGSRVWACAHPECTHHMPKYMEDAVIGKMAQCWNCETSFVLDPIAMAEDMPRCKECREGMSASTRKLLELFKDREEKETA